MNVMASQQALSPTQLAWVREPLSELLKQVRVTLENRGNDADLADLNAALQHLSQLASTLRVLGIEGAARAVDEMRLLTQDLLDGSLQDEDQKALGVLLGGTVVVDDYLDRLQIGQNDLPLVLLPLINDLRAARGKSLLPEGVFFQPPLEGDLPPLPVLDETLRDENLPALRKHYQTALRNWLRLDQSEASLQRMMIVCDGLGHAFDDAPEQRLWRVAAALVHGLKVAAVSHGIGIKRLLVRMDVHLKRLLADDQDQAALHEESDLLTRSLLFYLAMAEPGDELIDAVCEHYRLTDLLPDKSVLEQAWGSVRGRNREVFESVAKGVMDGLLEVKDVLDLQMRAGSIDPEAVRPLSSTLNNAANTLDMLNVAGAAELVRGESLRLQRLVDHPDEMNQEALIETATSLLQVEAHIQRAAEAMGEVEQERAASRLAMGGHEFGKVIGTLLSHTLDNLHLAQQQLEQWLSGSADSGAGNTILRLLLESSGAVQMLDMRQVSGLLRRSADYLREEVVEATDQVDDDRIATFADVLAALEIYLISQRDRQGDRPELLQRASEQLASLGYEYDESAIPEVAVETPAASDEEAAATPDAGAVEVADEAPADSDAIGAGADDGFGDLRLVDDSADDAEETAADGGDQLASVETDDEQTPAEAAVGDDDFTIGDDLSDALELLSDEALEAEAEAKSDADEQETVSVGDGDAFDFALVDDDELDLSLEDDDEDEALTLDDQALDALSLVDDDVREPEDDSATAAAADEDAEAAVTADEDELSLDDLLDISLADEDEAAAAVTEEDASEEPRSETIEVDDLGIEDELSGAEVEAPAEAATPAPPTEQDTADVSEAAEDKAADSEAPTVAEFEPVAANQPEIDPEFLDIFLEEYEAEYEALAAAMPQINENPYDRELLTDVRRSFHTLKGSGRMVGANEIGEFAWVVEDLLNATLDDRIAISDVLPLITESVAVLPGLKDRLMGESNDQAAAQAAQLSLRMKQLLDPNAVMAEEDAAEAEAEAADTDQITAEQDEQAAEPVAADSADEAVEDDLLDATLVDLICSELEEHNHTLRSYLDGLEQQGWADVPDEILIRAVHTLAGNLGLARWPQDTEALHLVERYLRELNAMRQPPGEGGVQLLGETIRLTDQRLRALRGTQDEEGSAAEVVPQQLGVQAQMQLDQLYRQLEADLADQSAAMDSEAESSEQESEQGSGDDSESLLEEFDFTPFDNEAAGAAVDGDDPWASSLFGETKGAADEQPEGEREAVAGNEDDWLTGSDFAALLGDESSEQVSADSEQPAEREFSEGREGLPADADEADATAAAESPLDDTAEAVSEDDEAVVASAETSADELAADAASSDDDAAELVADEEAGSTDEVDTAETDDSVEDLTAAAAASAAEDDISGDRLSTLLEGRRRGQREEVAEEQTAAAEEYLMPADADEANETVAEALERSAVEEQAPAPVRASTQSIDYDALDADLLEIFLGESEEILEGMDNALLNWREENDPASLDELRRQLHTLKGGARMAGLDLIGELGHELETMLELQVPKGIEGVDMDTIQLGCDELHGMLEAANQRAPMPLSTLLGGGEAAVDESEPEEAEAPSHEAVADHVDSDSAAEAAEAESLPAAAQAATPAPSRPEPAEPAVETARPAAAEYVRVNAALLDNLVNFAGEISIFRSRLEQEIGSMRNHVTEVEETVQRLRDQLRKLELETEAQILSRYQRESDDPQHEFDPLEMDRYSTIQQLSRALAESVNDLMSLQEVLDNASSQSETLLLQQSRVNTELQEGLMQTRLVPFASLAPRLRRVVRRAAAETDRRARLDIDFKGGEGLLDRNVLERITAPLEHMLRNSVVHGIELPDTRVQSGKPGEGNITITVDREATELLIRVADDGRGIDTDKVHQRAKQLGLTSDHAELSENEILHFIFNSGFSTASELTELAGRGVGMDVVANEVRQLGGSIEIQTVAGQGTTFSIRIPLTLAVMQAIMVRAGERIYAIPLNAIRGVAKMTAKEYIETIDASQQVYEYGGRDYPILELDPQLGAEPLGAPDGPVPLLMIEAGETRAALRVAELQNHREIVVKPVGPQISSIPGILGGTITGDGQVVVILDMGPLIRLGLSQSRLAGVQPEYMSGEFAEQKRTPLVLVVDDSITMRKVTARVLENRKLEVMTARDGLDAVEVMYDRVPDLILLDIEMPRMDGYELATHVRNDPRLRDIPMMIISSRSGEKHRQRGEEVGVDRYLGKPYREADLVRNVFELLEIEPQD
ncbi:MAG: hypothetical protein Tsb002_25180 [Wenzhouxiangellaceae bacterium]